MRNTAILLLAAFFSVGAMCTSRDDRPSPPNRSDSVLKAEQPKADPVKAATLHAGFVTGMAIVCGFSGN